MNHYLVVVRGFGPYAKGDVVAEAALVAAILGDERARNVVKVAAATQGG